jgi:cytochrome c-type biogenesis protein
VNGTEVSYVGAFAGGVVSFASPCVLPLVPAYLSIVTGLDISQPRRAAHHHLGRVARDTGLFIAGFSAVFILLGLSATEIGRAVFRSKITLTRVSGVVVVAMALFLLGSLVLRAPWLYQEKRFQPRLSRFGLFAAPVAGAAFGFGWTPCIGPILTSVLAVASTQRTAAQGAALLGIYSLGLGVPFLLGGLAFSRLFAGLGWIKRHLTAMTATASVGMAGFGVLLVLNRLAWVTSRIQQVLDLIGLHRLINLG